MATFDWRGVLRTVAPTVATLLGGPLAGVGVNALCDVLGLDKTLPQDKLNQQISAQLQIATPEALLKLKEMENEVVKFLTQAGIDLERIHAEDRASARNRQVQTKDRFPNILMILLSLMFAGVLTAQIFLEIPVANAKSLDIMLGSLGTAWLSGIYFFYGTSRGSQNKDVTMAQIIAGSK